MMNLNEIFGENITYTDIKVTKNLSLENTFLGKTTGGGGLNWQPQLF